MTLYRSQCLYFPDIRPSIPSNITETELESNQSLRLNLSGVWNCKRKYRCQCRNYSNSLPTALKFEAPPPKKKRKHYIQREKSTGRDQGCKIENEYEKDHEREIWSNPSMYHTKSVYNFSIFFIDRSWCSSDVRRVTGGWIRSKAICQFALVYQDLVRKCNQGINLALCDSMVIDWRSDWASADNGSHWLILILSNHIDARSDWWLRTSNIADLWKKVIRYSVLIDRT